uniref:Lymphocyte activation gene 3 protein n=1 Tax=Lepisosteus oculatus TaxID=7918 RepID=W5MJR6_LEPOC|nr:PREDICTED: lymphocyte activation gene 3 protein-like [Lepisosteus oculatus]
MRLIALVVWTILWASVTQGEMIEVFAERGSTAVLPCLSHAPLKNPLTVQWTKRNNMMESTVWRMERSGMEFWGSPGPQRSQCPHSGFQDGDFRLIIQEVRESDAGEYKCTARGSRGIVQKTVILRIIIVLVSQSLPLEGSTVSLNCSIQPQPQKATVSWLNNGTVVGNSPKTEVTKKGWTLTVKRLTLADATDWSCVVHTARQTGRGTQRLTVRGIASPASDGTMYGAVGSSLTLPCLFSEGLIPQQKGWERETRGAVPQSITPSPPSPSSSPSLDASLRLSAVEERDGGVYTCFGLVEDRRIERRLRLVTAKVGVTAPPKAGQPLTLTCDLSDATGVDRYEWFRVTSDANGTEVTTPLGTSSEKSFRLAGGSGELSGELVCQFHGKEGALGNVSYHFHTLGRLEATTKGGSSSQVAIITTFSFLVLVLILILLQMYKNHRRRKMILPYPALETVIHSSSRAQERTERKKTTDPEPTTN